MDAPVLPRRCSGSSVCLLPAPLEPPSHAHGGRWGRAASTQRAHEAGGAKEARPLLLFLPGCLISDLDWNPLERWHINAQALFGVQSPSRLSAQADLGPVDAPGPSQGRSALATFSLLPFASPCLRTLETQPLASTGRTTGLNANQHSDLTLRFSRPL